MAVAALIAALWAGAPSWADSPAVLRSRILVPDPHRLASARQPGETVPMRLFEDSHLAAVLERAEPRGAGTLLWQGHVRDEPGSHVLLVVTPEVVVGSIRSQDRVFRIRPLDPPLHVIEEIAPGAYPADSVVRAPVRRSTAARGAAARQLRPGNTTLDVLVLFTPGARREAGGRAGIRALIELGIAETNLAFAQSAARVRVRLVKARKISYAESDSIATDRVRLQRRGDGFLERAHRDRDKVGADLVQLLVANVDPDRCGSAYVLGDGQGIPPEHEAWAFGVTRVDCVSPNYTFGHEIGHNMGLEHAREDEPEILPAFPYAYGYRDGSGYFRTIMALFCPTCGPRLLHFSNPKVRVDGRATGVRWRRADSAHNVRSINKSRRALAAFRECRVDCEEPE